MRDSSFTNLVFEGGGVKGIAYVGALSVLEQRGIRPHVTAVAGASAGAITASLVAAGYSADELRQTMLAMDLKQFEDGGLEGPLRLIEHFGWYRGNDFLEWIGEQLAQKLGSPKVTFAELAGARQIDLRVVIADLSTHASRVFSAAQTPDAPVALAVRMSMSIPLFFAAVRNDQAVYVDGGTLWNYPIEIFDGPDGCNWQTLGFHLGLLGQRQPHPRPISDIAEYAKALYESIMRTQVDYFERSDGDVERSVFIDDFGIRATDFGLSTELKEKLIESGASATTAYLDAYT